MSKAKSMMCPECGVEMNHHADKPIHPTGSDDAGLVDPALGVIVEEQHTCPGCGRGASRHQAGGA